MKWATQEAHADVSLDLVSSLFVHEFSSKQAFEAAVTWIKPLIKKGLEVAILLTREQRRVYHQAGQGRSPVRRKINDKLLRLVDKLRLSVYRKLERGNEDEEDDDCGEEDEENDDDDDGNGGNGGGNNDSGDDGEGTTDDAAGGSEDDDSDDSDPEYDPTKPKKKRTGGRRRRRTDSMLARKKKKQDDGAFFPLLSFS